jgi:hypothetical protein
MSNKKIEISRALITYTVRSIISNKVDEYNIEITSGLSIEISNLIHKAAIELLQNEQSLQMKTIRLQVDMNLEINF